jgi:TRAP-type C4-dicarboxylate transport system substrate-binding protein
MVRWRVTSLGRIGAWVVAACLLVSTPAWADDPVQLKLSHWLPPSHPLQAAIEDWSADIQKQSGGTITSTIFPAEQLGKAFDHYDMARDGIADFTYVSPGYQPGRFPVIALSDLPFTYSDGKGGTAALDAWYRAYAAREMKDVHFCFAFIQDPGGFFSKTKVVLPTDMKGLKVRPANGSTGALVTLLGGNNVQASAPGARDLLERGVADGIFFPWGSMVLFGIDKVINYAVDTQFFASSFVWVMNKDKYEGLSPAQRKVIDDHCTTDWAVRFASPWVDFEAAGRPKIRAEPGKTIITLTPEQLAQWRTAAAPLHDSWAAAVRKTGGNPDAIAKAFDASLASYKAALH